jgi:predicted nucleotide-binding protein (sugar kinase/HSP70/actin superfamily)
VECDGLVDILEEEIEELIEGHLETWANYVMYIHVTGYIQKHVHT